MADDNHSRYRPNDPYGRGPASAAPSNDPLAELARLIGQNSGGADYGRSLAQPAASGYGNAAPSYDHSAQSYSDSADPAYGDDGAAPYEAEPHYADERPAQGDWQNSGLSSPDYRPDDQYPLPLPHQTPLPDTRAYDRAYGQQDHGHQDQDHQGYAGQSYAEPVDSLPRDSYRPDPNFDAGHDYQPAAYSQQTFQQPLYPQEPGAGAMPPPHDDEFYDDAPEGRRRRSVMTVVAVMTLAVIGTAGAFGYRSLFGGPSVPAVPPVIRASNEPSKVAPPPVPDQTATKFTYDRFSDAGKDEQIVPRDEKPLDLSKLTPPPTAPVAPTRPQGGAAAAANPPSAIGDPRRVRTVPIRPSQPDMAAVVAPAPAPPPRQAVATSEPPVTADPPQPASRIAASSKVASRPTRPGHTSPPAANAPLSLSPDANNALPPASPARDSAPRSSAPARIPSAPASGGGYLVQVSSQKSEADAQTAYRGISSKYSSVIGGKPHTVRRADLGSKGIYYRAMVGPFASREQAVSLCASLKQAGGDCVVQH